MTNDGKIQRKKGWVWLIPHGFIACMLVMTGCVSVSLFPPKLPLQEKTLEGTGAEKILLISLSGLIADGKDDGILDHDDNLVSRVREELTRAAKDEHVKAMLLRINSPGGTVTASDILYHEVMMLKHIRKIPVVAVIMDVGASGGYYVAAAADRIVAHPTSVTGSVGVIMLRVSVEGLLQKVGLEALAIKSGEKKDIGSPFRPMADDERTIFQSMINGYFARFLEVVQKGRSFTPAQLKPFADGRILTGPQAAELGLVDQVGYLDDGIALAKQLARLPEDARVVTYARPGSYKQNIYSLADGVSSFEALTRFDVTGLARGSSPQFYYLWMP
jgi:protease IV